jgi:F-type H+-transporting ATPase subunit gamma
MNIRHVRKKIKSVTNVKKITNAMQLVSAIKMKKAQQKAIEARPYQQDLQAIIKKISAKIDPKHSILLGENPKAQKKELFLLITANKGLCGSFNFNLFRYLLKSMNIKDSDFVVIGKKGASLISRMGGVVIADYSSNIPIMNVSAVFEFMLKHFMLGSYRQISIIYNSFISALKIEPVKETLLPVSLHLEDLQEKQFLTEYLIEPSPELIIDSLLKSYVEERIRNAIIQSEAGEHSSRMMAMKNATDNANDVIYNLTLIRNKLRQEKITNELLDMITAKESVEAN